MENHTSIKNTEYKFYQVKECLTDPQPWILALHAFLQCLQGGGLTSVSELDNSTITSSNVIPVLQDCVDGDSWLHQPPGYFDEHALQHDPPCFCGLCVRVDIC